MNELNYSTIGASLLTKPWSVGWHDRGMGHGDYGIVVKDTNELIAGPFSYIEVPEHIVDLHNKSLEDGG